MGTGTVIHPFEFVYKGDGLLDGVGETVKEPGNGIINPYEGD